MKPDTLIDYATFHLSPRRSRCELFVSSDGNTEKLASGSVKPFVTHLKTVEQQVKSAVHSIKLEVKRSNAESWFTKETLERFVQFVSTPEILESIITLDAEMTQLEAARKIYSQGAGDQISYMSGADGPGTSTTSDATKKELLRAIDVRLATVKEDITAASARASAAGFNLDTVSELQHFADHFGARRLIEACTKFMLLHQRRVDLLKQWKPSAEKQDLRASFDSDMSIDDPAENQSGLQHEPQLAEKIDYTDMQSRTVQTIQQLSDQSKSSRSFTTFPLQCTVKNEKSFRQDKQEDLPREPSSSEANRPAKQLSVQDRINLFENKQKENSGGKSVNVKPPDLRRLSSDVVSAGTPMGMADKTVLRRWSGVSDMSIDSSVSDKKDNADSPVYMSLSSASQAKSDTSLYPVDSKESNGLSDTLGSEAVAVKNASGGSEQSGLIYQVELQPQQGSSLEHKDVNLKMRTKLENQADFQSQFKCSISENLENIRVGKQAPVEKLKVYSDANESDSFKYQANSGSMLKGSLDRTEPVAIKNQSYPQTFAGGSVTKADNAIIGSGAANGVKLVGLRDHALAHNIVSQGHKQYHLVKLEGEFGLHIGEAPNGTGLQIEVPNRTTKDYQLSSQPRWRPHLGEAEVSQKGLISSEKQPSKGKDSGIHKMKFQEKNIAYSAKVTLVGQLSSGMVSKTPSEQVQKVKQLNGNQNINYSLEMKANELEKLFAEHQLCFPGKQSTAHKNNPMNKAEQEVSLQYIKPATLQMAFVKKVENDAYATPNNLMNFTNESQKKLDATPDYSSKLARKFSEVGILDDSRGKFYNKYMQKREKKLREEWSTKRPEKEAKLKAMQDSWERSKAEIKTMVLGSVDRKISMSGSCRRVQRLRSFSTQSIKKIEQSEEDEDSCFSNEKHQSYGRDKLFSQEVASRSTRSMIALPSRNTASMTPHNGTPSISGSSVSPYSHPGKCTMHSENILAQSISNSSDVHGENVKASGVRKMATQAQVRSHARSKSTIEPVLQVAEEKPQRCHSLRFSSTSTKELRDASLSSNGVVLELDRSQSHNSLSKKLSSMEPKHLMKNKTGKGVSAVIMSKKASSSAEGSNDNTREHDDLTFEEERRKEEEDELESMDVHDSTLLEEGKPIISADSHKFDYSGSEADESVVDVSADSSIGSPAASWNSHMLDQPEADIGRMRKKWGNAQNSILVPNSSQNQYREDTDKEFKRLLKFGKKNRGTENMADWESATTSEGDDDTEDIQDPSFLSSVDLRRSKMGFSEGPLHNGNESALLNEVRAVQSSIPLPPTNFKLREDHVSGTSIKAPRSFFSLSSFRSKGSDTKPR